MGRRADTSVAITVRLPYDVYREVVARARTREWSLNHYLVHCIRGEIGLRTRRERTRIANHNLELVKDEADALGE